MTIEPAAAIAARDLPGALLPGDPGYDEARVSFNGLLDRRPAVIVPCRTTDEVVAAVRAARAAGLPIAVRGGGHSVAGHSLAGRRARRLAGADARRRRSIPSGGSATPAAAPSGTTSTRRPSPTAWPCPAGRSATRAIGGLTLGGGIGWLMPVGGLTCDNLVEAEVVTADGSVVDRRPGRRSGAALGAPRRRRQLRRRDPVHVPPAADRRR